MLKYIEKSTADNITNQDIASVSELVDKVKKRKEVSINYMKSWEMEKTAHDEGLTEGVELVNELYSKLLAAGRTDEVLKAIQNKTYLQKLLNDFEFNN